MGWLLLLLIALLIYLLSRSGKSGAGKATPQSLEQRNHDWITFIAGYEAIVKTAKEKQLIRRMLSDIQGQGLSLPQSVEAMPDQAYEEPARQDWQTWETGAEPQPAVAQAVAPPQPKPELDNTTLLLYFGAFLFVASIGLFVAFGGANGVLRTVAVLLVTFVMYGGGLWLHANRPKLQQAGLAFVGIGVVAAPLFGVALYTYVLGRQHGPVAWLLTTILCLGLYGHALIRLRKPLLNYVFIFTFLSLFESATSVLQAPVYFYGWGLAIVGIALQVVSVQHGYWPDIRESSRQSAQLFVPLSLLAGLASSSHHGITQFGITLALAAMYYGLEALSSRDDEQALYTTIAQLSAIGAVGSLTFGIWHSALVTAGTILISNLVQIMSLVIARDVHSRLWQNFASILLLSSLFDAALVWQHPAALLGTTFLVVVLGLVVWWRQQRPEVYGLAALAFAATPYIFGQYIQQPHFSWTQQAILSAMTLMIILVFYGLQYKRSIAIPGWLEAARGSYGIAAIGVMATSFAGSPVLCLSMALVLAATMIVLAEHDTSYDFADAAGLFLAVPLFRCWSDRTMLLTSTLVALVLFIGLALRYRRELLRWGSTAMWLLLPVAVAHPHLDGTWTLAEYAWAYVAVMLALILSRAIARGTVFLSAKVPLASLARTASLSYVVGYVAAAGAAIGLSIASDQSQLHTTVILGLDLLLVALVSRSVEKRQDLLVLLPLLAQATWLSLIRPAQHQPSFSLFLLGSTLLAAISYYLAGALVFKDKSRPVNLYLQQTALVTAFIAPFSHLLAVDTIWPMPAGLLVAAGLVCYHNRQAAQATRELSGALLTASLLWFLALAHVHAVQAYTHLIVANLALYAYWRTQRGEQLEANNYLQAMLATATIPLAIQAIAGQAGGLYGWWLLLEQIAFMLLGMAIHKRFVIRWGLYVAVAAVLYQLRHLGWAALTFLAMFLIGLALYRLQRQNIDKK